MPAIIIPSRWTRQPTGPVEIDWSHPLSLSIDQAFLPQNGLDVVTGKLLTVTGSKISPFSAGVGRAFGATVGVGSTDALRIASPKLNLGPRCYLLQYLTKTDSGRFYSRAPSGSDVATERISVQPTNIFRFARRGASSDVGTSEWTTSMNVAHTAVVTNDYTTASNTKLFQDGQLITRNGSGTTTTATQIATDVLTLGNGGSGVFPIDGWMSLLVTWNRMLLDNEALELTRNPWQIFKPLVRRIYFDVSFKAAWARNRNTLIGAGVSL